MTGCKINMNRRQFLRVGSGSVAAVLLAQVPVEASKGGETERPNILWVSCEDTSPDLGCYGDNYAVTPNLDRLATQGVRYTNVYSNAGVCAPARSGIITGMYPSTIGTNHMRCKGVPPAEVKCFSEYLRAAGYYCTNNSKTDYQFDPPVTAWDESSRKAHWRGRAERQPFFAVMNFTISHESKNWPKKGEKLVHDPAKAVVPPYYPDTSVVRENIARYYDNVTKMDEQAGQVLRQLEQDGLADSTIVWFWGDHGRGLPRAKRWIYDSGIRVPLIIRVPERLRKIAMPDNPDALTPGTVSDDLVAFIDFAPTMLSLAGVKISEHIQGRAFLGSQKAEPRQYVFAARDRMDEAYDLIRAVRDKRYKYIRNYMPHITRGQDIEYMNRMPTMQEMRRLNAEGKLKGAELQYFEPTKPVEELYDTLNDPHEVRNLADDPDHKDVLKRMREVHKDWVIQTSDVGLIPEPEFDEMKRPGGQWQTTATPKFSVGSGAGDTGKHITITCATDGASIACRIDGGWNAKTGWKLYTKPVLLKSGHALYAKACRLGFRDSSETRLKLSGMAATVDVRGPKTASEAIPHWRDKLDQTDLLKRLWRVKKLDYKAEKAIADYLEALNDEYASVRYWAVVGLHNNCASSGDSERAKAALEDRLKDPAAVVRIAAAHALCDIGKEDEALPVLAEALKDKTDKARLYAAIALGRIGQKARPALPAIRAALKDKDNYVQRVTRAVLEQLQDK